MLVKSWTEIRRGGLWSSWPFRCPDLTPLIIFNFRDRWGTASVENNLAGRAESRYQQGSAVIPVTMKTITSCGYWVGFWMFTVLQKAHTLILRPRNKILGAQTTHCVLLKHVISDTKEFQNSSIFRPFCLTKTIARQLLTNQPLFLICARVICPGFLLYACKN